MWKEVIMDYINVPSWTNLKGLRRDDSFKIARLLTKIRNDIPDIR
jgi:hypothetical protein